MAWSRQRITYTVAVAIVATNLVVGAVLVRASGAPARPVPATTAPSPSRSPSPRPPLLSPFTGEPVRSLGPVLAVQLGNDAVARPWTGLAGADIVYVLPVEGGLSRLLAVFWSGFPAVIGPVRSAREEDLELLRQFGRPAFAYSGATPSLLPYIHRTAKIVDLYAGTTSGYYRDPSRAAPDNLYAHTKRLLAQAHGASTARGIGFRSGPPPPGGRVTQSASVSYPAASFRFTWSPAIGRWLVSMDGSPAVTTGGVRLSAATVVIQHTAVRTSHFLVSGIRPPYAESVGSGRAVVLRSGQAWTGHWSRPSADGGTTFTTAAGQRMTFARGQVWVVLAYP
jgi:Protein of unknown function (DUF3048) N-terminal domain/Protein of unknown function (DUF3048) C-terminal domain